MRKYDTKVKKVQSIYKTLTPSPDNCSSIVYRIYNEFACLALANIHFYK